MPLHEPRLAFVLSVVACLAIGGCAQFQTEDLEAYKTPNCEQPAGIPMGAFGNALGLRPPLVNWSGCDKTGAELSGADLSNAILSGTTLRSAALAGADLSGANLTGAALSGADL